SERAGTAPPGPRWRSREKSVTPRYCSRARPGHNEGDFRGLRRGSRDGKHGRRVRRVIVISPPFFAASFFALQLYVVPKPDPGFLYSGRGGLKMSSTRAPSGPARMVCGTLPGVRQKSPFFTSISSPPCTP